MLNIIDWLDRIKTKITRMSWLPLGGALVGIVADFFILLLLEATAYASDCPPGGFTDCANAATIARHPATPIIGAVLGWVVGSIARPSNPEQPPAGGSSGRGAGQRGAGTPASTGTRTTGGAGARPPVHSPAQTSPPGAGPTVAHTGTPVSTGRYAPSSSPDDLPGLGEPPAPPVEPSADAGDLPPIEAPYGSATNNLGAGDDDLPSLEHAPVTAVTVFADPDDLPDLTEVPRASQTGAAINAARMGSANDPNDLPPPDEPDELDLPQADTPVTRHTVTDNDLPPTEEADQKDIQHQLDVGQALISRVTDPQHRQFLEDFLNRNANDPDKLRRAVDAVRRQTFETDQQRNLGESEAASAEAGELGGREQYVEGVRDNAMRVNRGLAHLEPTGTGARIVNAQGIAYGAAQGYEEDGVRGAIGRSAAGVLDNYTAGAGTTIYEGSLEGASAATMGGNYIDNIRNQFDPGRIAQRLGEATVTAEQGGGIGSLVDGVLDTVDFGRDLRGG